MKQFKESNLFLNCSNLVKNFKIKSTKNIRESNSKHSLNPNGEILATRSNKAVKNVAEYSEPILKVEENLNQKTACKSSVTSVDNENKNLLMKADLSLKSTSHQTDFDSSKKETKIFETQHPFHDLFTFVRKEDKGTGNHNIEKANHNRKRIFNISQKENINNH